MISENSLVAETKEKIRDLKSELWITNHLTEINNLCLLKGESPFYKK